MDPDTSTSSDQPSTFNYVLSFLLVGLAWGFTTPFIRRAAADFNVRQEAKQQRQQDPLHSEGTEQEAQELLSTQRDDDGDRDEDENENENGREPGTRTQTQSRGHTEDDDEVDNPPGPSNSDSVPTPAWKKTNHPSSTSSWLKTKLVALFWTVVNLLRTPAYSIPLVINLTGSIWFFLLVGKHELSLTVPLANSSAFLFTVLGEWYVERKVIARETWLGMFLVLGGIALCVHSKNQTQE